MEAACNAFFQRVCQVTRDNVAAREAVNAVIIALMHDDCTPECFVYMRDFMNMLEHINLCGKWIDVAFRHYANKDPVKVRLLSL